MYFAIFVAHVVETRSLQEILVGELKGRDRLRIFGVDERIILKSIN